MPSANSLKHGWNTEQPSQEKMKILQINSRSINTSQYLINDYVKAKKVELICISETWDLKKVKNLKAYSVSC